MRLFSSSFFGNHFKNTGHWRQMLPSLLAMTCTLLLTLALLTACAPTGDETPAPEDPEEPGVTTLTYAILSPENVDYIL